MPAAKLRKIVSRKKYSRDLLRQPGPGHLIFLLLNVCALIWKKELYCLMKRKHFYSSIEEGRRRKGRRRASEKEEEPAASHMRKKALSRTSWEIIQAFFCQNRTWPGNYPLSYNGI